MGKTIDLIPYTEQYRQSMAEAVTMLADFEQQLFDNALYLLITGKWRKWADEQPVGTVFNFREKEMLEAGDKTATALLELKEKVVEVMEELKAKPH